MCHGQESGERVEIPPLELEHFRALLATPIVAGPRPPDLFRRRSSVSTGEQRDNELARDGSRSTPRKIPLA
eukprot:2173232-Lingulodinium_polyedra.AAC.1